MMKSTAAAAATNLISLQISATTTAKIKSAVTSSGFKFETAAKVQASSTMNNELEAAWRSG